MRKLTADEQGLCVFLAKLGHWTPGDAVFGRGGPEVLRVMRSLERKGRVQAEPTDDGPRFTLTMQGEADAS